MSSSPRAVLLHCEHPVAMHFSGALTDRTDGSAFSVQSAK